MKRNDNVQKYMDAVLKELITAGALGAGIMLPNLLIALEKPMDVFFAHLSKRERAREARRIIYYMKGRGLLAGEYEFGLGITKKGHKKLKQLNFEQLHITDPNKWDGLWRIVFYDIPEKQKSGRDALTARLRQLGFFQLQRSVWVHPFPCREVIEKLAVSYGIQKYISYVEANHIDNQNVLVSRFKKLNPKVSFK